MSTVGAACMCTVVKIGKELSRPNPLDPHAHMYVAVLSSCTTLHKD